MPNHNQADLSAGRRRFEQLEQRSMLSASGWAFSAGNPALGDDGVSGMAVDSQDNLYVAGSFYDSIDLDQDNVPDIYSANGEIAGFVAKYTSSGEFVWAKVVDGRIPPGTAHLALDSSEDLYAVFNFTDSTDLFTKLDADNGETLFSREITEGDAADVAIDDDDNIYLTGSFFGTVVFETTPGGDQVSLTSAGSVRRDIYVAKYSADGTAVWATRAGAPDAHDEGFAIAVDDAGLVYVGGKFNESASGGADFGDQELHVTMPANAFKKNGTLKPGYNYKHDVFVAQLDASSGGFNWAVSAAAESGIKDEEAVYNLAVDEYGDVYVAGQFDSTRIDFNNGVFVTNSDDPATYYNDGFLAKLNPSGAFEWAHSFGAPGVNDYSYPLAFDDAGRLFFGGLAHQGAHVGGFEVFGEDGDGFVAEVDTNTGAVKSLLPVANGTATWALAFGPHGDMYSGGVIDNLDAVEFPTGELLASQRRLDLFVMKLDAGTPFIRSLVADAARVSAGASVDFTAVGAFDVGGAVDHIDFYLDDGDGELDPLTDQLIATDADAADAWSATLPTEGLDAGQYAVLAQATDIDGLVSEPVSATVEILEAPPTIDTQIYIHEIRFDSRRGGKDYRAVVEVRDDEGNAVSGVQLKVDFAGQTYELTTDGDGIARTDWQRKLDRGEYYANAYDLALTDYYWDPFSFPFEDDSDGDGRADALLTI